MFIKRILLATTPELSLGLFLIFSSSVGQTFFISLFSGEIRNAFNLSHGMFGILYSVATLTSATLFFWLGKLTDQFNLTVLGLITLGILSGFSFLLSSAETLLILFLSLLGLRLFGQSMISHIAVTAMARWFSKKRGRALSVALMGHPIGEALLPSLITFFLFQYTWREIWIGIGTCIIIIFLPLVYWLGRHIKLNKDDSYNSKQTKSKKNLIDSSVSLYFHVHPSISCKKKRNGVLLEIPGDKKMFFTYTGGNLTLEKSTYIGNFFEPQDITKLVIENSVQQSESKINWKIEELID